MRAHGLMIPSALLGSNAQHDRTGPADVSGRLRTRGGVELCLPVTGASARTRRANCLPKRRRTVCRPRYRRSDCRGRLPQATFSRAARPSWHRVHRSTRRLAVRRTDQSCCHQWPHEQQVRASRQDAGIEQRIWHHELPFHITAGWIDRTDRAEPVSGSRSRRSRAET